MHWRPRAAEPEVLVEMPDGTARALPLTATDRAPPNPHRIGAAPGARLSGLALLEVVAFQDRQKGTELAADEQSRD